MAGKLPLGCDCRVSCVCASCSEYKAEYKSRSSEYRISIQLDVSSHPTSFTPDPDPLPLILGLPQIATKVTF